MRFIKVEILHKDRPAFPESRDVLIRKIIHRGGDKTSENFMELCKLLWGLGGSCKNVSSPVFPFTLISILYKCCIHHCVNDLCNDKLYNGVPIPTAMPSTGSVTAIT